MEIFSGILEERNVTAVAEIKKSVEVRKRG